MNIKNYSNSQETLGNGLNKILTGINESECLELIINSNSGNIQTIFIDTIKTIEIYSNYAVITEINEHNVFLNLNNVLSIAIIGV